MAPGGPPAPPFATSTPAGPASDTAGLRRAAIVLYWVTSAAMAVFALALISRKRTWSDYESGGDVSFRDLDQADNFVGGMLFVALALALATTIVVSIWSLRVARHAQRIGAVAINPGLACGGWYIPFANTIVPFVQLRRVADHSQRPTQFLNTWMGLAIATLVLSLIFRAGNGDGSFDVGDDVSAMLTREVVFGVLLVVTTAAMAFVASRAMRDVEGVGRS